MHRRFTVISPIALLTLTACGGGGGLTSGPPNGPSATSVGGNVVKGPLSNALVGLDYDGDGIIDSATVRTDDRGGYTLTTQNSTYTIVAVTDGSTIDTSSGTVLSGITLKAPKDATVVTPTTTLIEEAGITAAEVSEVLGLPEGVDLLSFNPFSDEVDASDALAVEKASQQIMSVVNAFASAAEGSGASEEKAFESALNSVVEVVKSKAEKLSDPTATETEQVLDLTNASDLALIKSEVAAKVTELAAEAGSTLNAAAFEALADETVTAVKNVNDKIATVTDIASDEAKNTFSTTQVLADQIKTATQAEAQNSGSGAGAIDFVDPDKVDAAAANSAPTDILLSNASIAEDTSSLLIGTLSTVDPDQPDGVVHTYAIAEVDGTDFEAFSIDASGNLSFKPDVQPDYETKSSYSVTILSTDQGGKVFSQSIVVSITDVDETGGDPTDPVLSISVDLGLFESSSQTFATELLEFADDAQGFTDGEFDWALSDLGMLHTDGFASTNVFFDDVASEWIAELDSLQNIQNPEFATTKMYNHVMVFSNEVTVEAINLALEAMATGDVYADLSVFDDLSQMRSYSVDMMSYSDPENSLPPSYALEDLVMSTTVNGSSSLTIRNEYFSPDNTDSGIAELTFTSDEGVLSATAVPMALELVGMLTQPEWFDTAVFRDLANNFVELYGINKIEFADEQGAPRYSINVNSVSDATSNWTETDFELGSTLLTATHDSLAIDDVLTALFDSGAINPVQTAFAAAQWADEGTMEDPSGNDLKIVVNEGSGNATLSLDTTDIYATEDLVLGDYTFGLMDSASDSDQEAVSDDGTILIQVSNTTDFTSEDLSYLIATLDLLEDDPIIPDIV